ncbi:DUF6185 family protein [Streptomyces sp. H39-S7]|nr:DUF6185 family protein [Streptomyces sp. H39-S7]MCZ4125055.1 DUF6185 family protein [Streptomyces sp. H39-S7]
MTRRCSGQKWLALCHGAGVGRRFPLRLTVVLLVVAVFSLCGAGTGRAEDASSCDPAAFKASTVSTRLTLLEHHYDVALLQIETEIEIPYSWKFRAGVFYSPRSSAYRRAMRCLLASGEGTIVRDGEERDSLPTVIGSRKETSVSDSVHVWIRNQQIYTIGAWSLRLAESGYSLTLVPPPALELATWKVTLSRDSGDDLVSSSSAPDTLSDDALYIWQDLHLKPQHPFSLAISAPWRIRTISKWGEYPQELYIAAAKVGCFLILTLPYLIAHIRERRNRIYPRETACLTWAVGLQASLAFVNFADFGSFWFLNEKGYFDDPFLQSLYQRFVAGAWALVSYGIFFLGILRHFSHRWVSILPAGALLVAAWVYFPIDPISTKGAAAVDGIITTLLLCGLGGMGVSAWQFARSRDVHLRHLIIVTGLGFSLSIIVLGMFLRSTITTRRDQQWILDDKSIDITFDVINYPSYLYDSFTTFWWLAVVLAAIPVLVAMPYTRRVNLPMRVLVTFIGGIALENWPDYYAGVPSALTPLITMAILLLIMRLNRGRVILERRLEGFGSAVRNATLSEILAASNASLTDELHIAARDYHVVEQEGKKLEAAYKTAPEIKAEDYRKRWESIQSLLQELSEWPPARAATSIRPAASGLIHAPPLEHWAGFPAEYHLSMFP